MTISPAEIKLLVCIGIVMIPISWLIWKEFKDDHEEFQAINEAIGERTPY